MSYKDVVSDIRNLPWCRLGETGLHQLMHLSHASAVEFAESLRIALSLYPKDELLQMMANGELKTNNLQFGNYTQTANHSEFLNHFLQENSIACQASTQQSITAYFSYCRDLSHEVRAMTVFSREYELSGIFNEILKAKNWDTPALQAFNYYLRTHIHLDTDDGGHYQLTAHRNVDEQVEPFYKARLRMYSCLNFN
jgi:hypothetical protein